MKKSLKRIQKYKDLHQILSGYPAAFEGKPEALGMLKSLGILSSQLGELVSVLTSPVRSVYRTKQEVRDNFMNDLDQITRLCVIIATRTGNQPLLTEVKLYFKQLGFVGDLAHYQIATHVSEKLVQFSEESLNLGVTAADITAFALSPPPTYKRVKLSFRRAARNLLFLCQNLQMISRKKMKTLQKNR